MEKAKETRDFRISLSTVAEAVCFNAKSHLLMGGKKGKKKKISLFFSFL